MERYTMMQLVASLGVSLATIRSWLAQAEIVAQRDTYDPRCYYVSRADAERLALLHGRVSLTPIRNMENHSIVIKNMVY